MEMLGLLGLPDVQDKPVRRSRLAENLATGTARKYIDVPKSAEKYLEVLRSTKT